MPRSPTMHQLGRARTVSRTTVDGLDERGRVGGVAGEHPHRDRAAGRVGEQPVLDLRAALLAVAGVAARGQRAVAALHPRRGQVEQRHPGRVGLRGQVPGGQLGLDARPGGPAASPSPRTPRRCDAPATPRSAPRVVSAHQAGWTASRPGRTTRETISASARSRCPPGRAQQRRAGPAPGPAPCTAATCPCGSDRVMVTAAAPAPALPCQRPARSRRSPRPAASDRLATVSLLDLPALAVGAAQQVRLVHPLRPVLTAVVATVTRHMHGLTTFSHTRIVAEPPAEIQQISDDTPARFPTHSCRSTPQRGPESRVTSV